MNAVTLVALFGDEMELEKRLLNLEIRAELEWKRFDEILEELEKRIKQLEDVVGEKPFKCPVCYGRGFKEDQLMKRHDCTSCENKGIVWKK